MKKLILIALFAAIGWQGYAKYQAKEQPQAAYDSAPGTSSFIHSNPSTTGSTPLTTYQCDGRTHCSQMTSCAEATFFLKNCPGTKMDGDHDGIPCEQQWCR